MPKRLSSTNNPIVFEGKEYFLYYTQKGLYCVESLEDDHSICSEEYLRCIDGRTIFRSSESEFSHISISKMHDTLLNPNLKYILSQDNETVHFFEVQDGIITFKSTATYTNLVKHVIVDLNTYIFREQNGPFILRRMIHEDTHEDTILGCMEDMDVVCFITGHLVLMSTLRDENDSVYTARFNKTTCMVEDPVLYANHEWVRVFPCELCHNCFIIAKQEDFEIAGNIIVYYCQEDNCLKEIDLCQKFPHISAGIFGYSKWNIVYYNEENDNIDFVVLLDGYEGFRRLMIKSNQTFRDIVHYAEDLSVVRIHSFSTKMQSIEPIMLQMYCNNQGFKIVRQIVVPDMSILFYISDLASFELIEDGIIYLHGGCIVVMRFRTDEIYFETTKGEVLFFFSISTMNQDKIFKAINKVTLKHVNVSTTSLFIVDQPNITNEVAFLGFTNNGLPIYQEHARKMTLRCGTVLCEMEGCDDWKISRLAYQQGNTLYFDTTKGAMTVLAKSDDFSTSYILSTYPLTSISAGDMYLNPFNPDMYVCTEFSCPSPRLDMYRRVSNNVEQHKSDVSSSPLEFVGFLDEDHLLLTTGVCYFDEDLNIQRVLSFDCELKRRQFYINYATCTFEVCIFDHSLRIFNIDVYHWCKGFEHDQLQIICTNFFEDATYCPKWINKYLLI
ncbi:hypothetical protein PCE1_004844 [Barthelona sp. PCE]